MVKTRFERVEVGSPDIAAFRVGGKLGFHENTMVQRLVEECLKRDIRSAVFDFSELSSLGGGVAKIFRDFVDALAAKGGRVSFVVTNDTITQFLQGGEHSVSIHRSILEAVSALRAPAAPVEPAAPAASAPAASSAARPSVADSAAAGSTARDSKGGTSAAGEANVIFMPFEGADSTQGASPSAEVRRSSPGPEASRARRIRGRRGRDHLGDLRRTRRGNAACMDQQADLSVQRDTAAEER